MNSTGSIEYLQSLEQFGSQLGLARIKLLLEKLRNPQDSLKCFHVAGTNGKGSVCAMISSILQESGYKVGMYTSPHFVDVRERFLINNKKISEVDFVRLLNKIKPLAEEVKPELSQPTYFEVTTALMFEYFKEQKIDYAVIEVGLGGRLDATNVIQKPLVSIITRIALEHTDILGETMQEIAFEKAGIIKQDVPVVTGADKEAYDLIKRIAEIHSSNIYHISKGYKGKVGLLGNFQKLNAALAIEAIKLSKVKVSQNSIKNGLEKVYWPGRLDLRIINGKRILFDSAHNPDCVRTIIPALKNFKYDRLILVTSILKDKDYKSMLGMLAPISSLTVLTQVKNDRAASVHELEKYIPTQKIVIPDPKMAINFAWGEAKKDDLILVTGSMYLLGEIYDYLKLKVF